VTEQSNVEGAVSGGSDQELSRGIESFSGCASDYAEKWHTERLARKAQQKKFLRLKTSKQASQPIFADDDELMRLTHIFLDAMTSDHRKRIRVVVKDGRITLAGEVESEHARRTALILVGKIHGVSAIIDHLVVMPELSVNSVKSEIQGALTRRSITDARDISVVAHGSEVTLLGTVRGRTERDLAVDAAWCTPGVRRVFDKLEIASA
jgi:osmotically-inducible protein OsmY